MGRQKWCREEKGKAAGRHKGRVSGGGGAVDGIEQTALPAAVVVRMNLRQPFPPIIRLYKFSIYRFIIIIYWGVVLNSGLSWVQANIVTCGSHCLRRL